MGMCADILAMGPYGPEIAAFLAYPAGQYAKTRVGTVVVTELFGILEGSPASRTFAKYLGVTDPWDFNQHKLVGSAVDVEGLRAFLATLLGGEDYKRDLEAFIALRDHGFEFFFRPNG
jgi:hypothetical protein